MATWGQVMLGNAVWSLDCRLVLEDWRKHGEPDSIYDTELGVELTMGDLHSGTTFPATVTLPAEVAREIEAAYAEHGAYPVFRLVPTKKDGTENG